MKLFFLRWLPLLFSMALIFTLSASHNPYRHIPAALVPPIQAAERAIGDQWVGHPLDDDQFLGNIGHVSEYLLLGVTAAHAALWQRKLSPGIFALTFVLCALYALSDETHQLFVPGRDFQLSDLALDCVGSFMGLLGYGLVCWRLAQGEVGQSVTVKERNGFVK
jgi:hypothetical protein